MSTLGWLAFGLLVGACITATRTAYWRGYVAGWKQGRIVVTDLGISQREIERLEQVNATLEANLRLLRFRESGGAPTVLQAHTLPKRDQEKL